MDRGRIAVVGMTENVSRTEIAGRIQSTLIHAGVTVEELERLCRDCRRFGFNAAMVPPRLVRLALEYLSGSGVVLASAVDFPLGVMTTVGRQAEACAIVAAGAGEIDVGLPVGLVKTGGYAELQADLTAVVRAVEPIPVKVMLELPLLSPEERDRVVDLAVDAGVAYVKNASSGAVGAATPADIAYLRARVPATVGVKASGGIKRYDQVVALLAAGADLVGTSAAVAIMGEAPPEDSDY